MKYSLIFGCLLFGAIFQSSCSRAEHPKLRVTGASTVYPIVQMAAEVLTAQHNVEVEAHAGGSTRGFEDTIAGRNDMGAMARELTAEERSQVVSFPIAYDGVGIALHSDNPLVDLTTDQLRAIYRKEITNWKDLGGADQEIVVINKAEGHATLESFLNHTGLDRRELNVDVVAGDNAQVIRSVTSSAAGIGYVSIGEAIHAAQIGMPIKLVRLDGIEPSLDRVADHSYPIFRTLYLVSKAEPEGPSKLLLDFLGGPEGHEIIKRGKYVPLP